MAEHIKDGGPAFPLFAEYEHASGAVVREFQFGMSLRDYFAGQALAGLCAVPYGRDQAQQTGVAGIVAAAYVIADDMLKAREAK